MYQADATQAALVDTSSNSAYSFPKFSVVSFNIHNNDQKSIFASITNLKRGIFYFRRFEKSVEETTARNKRAMRIISRTRRIDAIYAHARYISRMRTKLRSHGRGEHPALFAMLMGCLQFWNWIMSCSVSTRVF